MPYSRTVNHCRTMGRARKFDYQTAIEGTLTAHPDGLSLDEMLGLAGFEIDRSTLFRQLARLIEEAKVERVGKARASRYRWLGCQGIAAAPLPFMAPPPTEAAANEPGTEEPASTVRTEPEAAAPDSTRSDAPNTEAPEDVTAVNKAVRAIVRDWKRYDRINLHIYLSLIVAREHIDRLAATVEKELKGLHPGNLERFGLTPADLAEYTSRMARGAKLE